MTVYEDLNVVRTYICMYEYTYLNKAIAFSFLKLNN